MTMFVIQFLSYGFLGWAGFLLLPFVSARILGWGGIVVAHVIIGCVVLHWDIAWVQSEMAKPEWRETGTPDLDMIFMIGALFRIGVINLVVTPLGIWGALLRRAARKRKSLNAVQNLQSA